MKAKLIIVLALIVWAGTSCEQKVDVAKEEAAIKALFEKNKNDYFKGDYKTMSEDWVKDPSSVKMWISAKGSKNIVGWDNIVASEQKEIQERKWDPKLMNFSVVYSHMDIMEDCAWVLSNTNWKGTIDGQNLDIKQSRITVLKKIDGKWKFSLFAFYNE
jgi:hypothetical protein